MTDLSKVKVGDDILVIFRRLDPLGRRTRQMKVDQITPSGQVRAEHYRFERNGVHVGCGGSNEIYAKPAPKE
jgi:hypothetical protein